LSQLLSNESLSGFTSDQIVLLLAERMRVTQADMSDLKVKLSQISAGMPSPSAIAEIAGQLRQAREDTERRLRAIEDWKTGDDSRAKFLKEEAARQWKYATGAAAIMSSVAGIVAHFWR
jgi:uncharacterized protein YoaH (UPF0181 family)